MNCQVRCHPRLYTKLGRVLGHENVKELRAREAIPIGGGLSLRALFTPGHADDHVCYYMPGERVMFSGDTILGGSSTTVSDLYDYMKFPGAAGPLSPKNHLSRPRPCSQRGTTTDRVLYRP